MKIRKILYGLLVLLALGYLGYEYVYIPHQLSKVVVNTVSVDTEVVESSVQNPTGDKDVFTDTAPTTEQVIEARKSIEGHYGLIAIEDTALNVPIFRGLSDYGMWRGGVTWDANMRFGEGHTVLFGHNVRETYLFGYITRAQVGKEVYGYDGKAIYVYEVVESRKGTQYEIDYVESGSFGNGRPTITLVTCVDGFPTEKRWFVRATLKKVVYPIDKEYTDLKDKNGWE